ncbi:MAG: ECF transporter S component [Ruminococcaceae bacterium]|nr:ECF transporter S component [Oscillospiraceae bacterium]
MNKKQIHDLTLKLTITAVLTALVIVLQLFGSVFRVGTVNLSFVLIPIVLGGIFVGKSGGAFLGALFGLITLIAGITGTDPFTHILFTNSPVITALICLGKGTLAGLGSAWLYQLVSKKNSYVATFVASAAAPVINTGLFIFGALFLKDVISTNFVAEGTTFLYFLIIGCAGINFIFEFIINLIFSPGIYSIVKAITKKK